MEISCRVPIGFDAIAFGDYLVTLAGADGAVEILESEPAVRSARGNVAVRALRQSLRERGLGGTLKVKLGTSDMNLVVARWGVPAAAYGAGDSHLCHSADERLPLADFRLSIDVLADALVRLADTIGAAQ